MSDKDIENEIRRIMKELDIDRMPSRQEIYEIDKNNVLINNIARGYGFYEWAEKLELQTKDSETKLGNSYEQYCLSELENLGYKTSRTSTRASYDILVEDKLKIDVKSGAAYFLKGSRCHTFNLETKFHSCDLYIIYALNENKDKVEKTLIIPSSDLPISTLSIGEISKYDKYINRWDYVDKYLNFYRNLH